MPARDRPDPIDKLWLIEQFNQIDNALADIRRQTLAILGKIDNLEAVPTPQSPVTTALARQIVIARLLSKSIDIKVED